MNDFYEFRECYQCWAHWIGFGKDRIHKNTIWHQCTEMMNNEFMFQALFLAGKKSATQPDYHSFLAANGALYRYLLDGYLGFQYLAIRRLTDTYAPDKDRKNVRGVASLSRLLADMRQHDSVITREAFVCVDGLPYDYKALLVQESAEQSTKMEGETERVIWHGEPGVGVKSARRHFMFDQMSEVVEQDRKPDDRVSLQYWQKCQKILEEPVLEQIKNFVDKYLAHAADEPSQATLEEEDKLLSMERIHMAQQSLISLIQRLTLDFYDRQYAMVPIFGEGQLLYNFSKPFASESIVKEVNEELQVLMQKQTSSF